MQRWGVEVEAVELKDLDIPEQMQRAIAREAEAIRGYCLAVRSSLTDDGRAPLDASGLKLQDRLTQISDSIARVEQKKAFR